MTGKKRNNAVGVKGKSGRKTIAKEIEIIKERITQEALTELSHKIIYKRLQKLEVDDNPNQEKDFAMPITLKGMTDKLDLTTKGKSLNYDDDQRRKIAERILRRKSDTGGSGKESSN
jgi:hypothetical protein